MYRPDYGHFTSSQFVDIVNDTDDVNELHFLIDFKCTSPGRPAQLFALPENCYPADAPEYELESIHLLDDEGKTHEVKLDLFHAILGKEWADRVLDAAELDALENDDGD